MNYQLVFRSPFGQVTAAVMAVVAVVFMGLIWRSDGFFPMLQSAPLPIGLAYFTWWIWGWPAVIADARGVLIRNQLRTYRISWDSFVKAESRFGLYIYVNESKYAEVPAVSPDWAADTAQLSAASATETSTSSLDSEEEVSQRSSNSAGTSADAAAGGRRVDGPNIRGELTIGDVDPISLDPDNLALRKPIYAAGVPARGGFKTATSKELPQVPTLDLRNRNRVVLRVTPMVAARILDEEKYYLNNPTERPELHSSREPYVPAGNSPLTSYGATHVDGRTGDADKAARKKVGANSSRGLRIAVNWLQISGLVAFIAYWVWMLT